MTDDISNLSHVANSQEKTSKVISNYLVTNLFLLIIELIGDPENTSYCIQFAQALIESY